MPSAPPSRRFWKSTFVAVVAATCGFFLLFEFALRVAGFGWSTRFFLDGQDGYTVTNPRFGRLFYPEELLRGAYPFKFSTRKAPGTLRVFVLGESAIAGTPEPSFSVTRVLEVLLRRACPDEKFEVINAGVTALNSHAVRLIARELVRYEPDAVIVYLGNNEVVGPFGPGSVLGSAAVPNSVVRPLVWLRSTRLGQQFQFLADQIQRSRRPEIWQGMDMFAQATVAPDDESLEIVYRNFAGNLHEIASHLRENGVPTLLCSVASNLTGCPPLGRSDAAQIAYAQAQRLRSANRVSDAAVLFRKARDQDPLRFRADSRLNSIVREVAEQTGCDFADIEQAVANEQMGSPRDKIPLFFEHVHFTFEGNIFFASILAGWLSAEWSPRLECLAQPALLSPANAAEIGEELGYSVLARGYSIGSILEMLRKPPFTTQPGNEARMRYWEEQLRAIEKEMTPEYVAAWTEKIRGMVASRPNDGPLAYWLGRHLEESHDFAGAAAAFESSLTALPGNPVAWWKLGDTKSKLGDAASAASAYEEVLRIFPAHLAARRKLSELREGRR
jgi:lysophospholipase L1-like esterase